jgi:hypothetical protein
MTYEEIAVALAERDIKSGDPIRPVLQDLCKKVRLDTLNMLGATGRLSWGKVAEITSED